MSNVTFTGCFYTIGEHFVIYDFYYSTIFKKLFPKKVNLAELRINIPINLLFKNQASQILSVIF